MRKNRAIRGQGLGTQTKIGGGRHPLLHLSNCGRTSGVEVKNQPARQHQVGHAEESVQLRRVLRQAAIGRLEKDARERDRGTDAAADRQQVRPAAGADHGQ